MFWKKSNPQMFVTKIDYTPERNLGEITGSKYLNNISLYGHSAIFGQTRSGKTTLAKQFLLALTGYKIFFNIQEDKDIHGMCDRTVYSVEELLGAIGENKRRINFVPAQSIPASLVQLNTIHEVLMILGEKISASQDSSKVGKTPIWVTLFCDEAHLLAPKNSKTDPLSTLTTRGLGHGIRVVSISQRPALLSQTICTQSGQFFIFNISNFEFKYFRSYNIDIDSALSFLRSGDHRYIYTDGTKIVMCDPIKI